MASARVKGAEGRVLRLSAVVIALSFLPAGCSGREERVPAPAEKAQTLPVLKQNHLAAKKQVVADSPKPPRVFQEVPSDHQEVSQADRALMELPLD